MHDWSVALVGYILGDQISIIGNVIFVKEVSSFVFFLLSFPKSQWAGGG